MAGGDGWVSQSLLEAGRGGVQARGRGMSSELPGCPDPLQCVDATSPAPLSRAISGLSVLSCGLLSCRVTTVCDVALPRTFLGFKQVLS